MWKLSQGPCLSQGSPGNELWQCPPVCPGSGEQQTGPSLPDVAAEGRAGGAHCSPCIEACAPGNVTAVEITQQAHPKTHSSGVWFKQQPVFGRESADVTQHFNLKRQRDIFPHSSFLYRSLISQDIFD